MAPPLDVTHSDPAIAELKRQLHEEVLFAVTMHREHVVPYLEAYVDLTRNLVTLAGGAIIASVSVAQFIRERSIDTAAGWLLALSWFFFAIAILAGLTRIGNIRAASGYAVSLLQQRSGLLACVDEATDYADAVKRVAETRNSVYSVVEIEANKHLKSDGRSGIFLGIPLLLGFVCLVAFALIDLAPWHASVR